MYWVLCNDGGDFVAARSLTIAGCLSVDVGEAMGFLEALSWLKELGCDSNKWAHVIARIAHLHESPSNWVDPPAAVVGLPRGFCS
ncbi:hypothetical protein ACS0TY_012532 [Phlomoides rotata]